MFPIPNRAKSLTGESQLHQNSCVPQYRSSRKPIHRGGRLGYWASPQQDLWAASPTVPVLCQPTESWHNPSGEEDWKGPKYVQMWISHWPGKMAEYRKLGKERCACTIKFVHGNSYVLNRFIHWVHFVDYLMTLAFPGYTYGDAGASYPSSSEPPSNQRLDSGTIASCQFQDRIWRGVDAGSEGRREGAGGEQGGKTVARV